MKIEQLLHGYDNGHRLLAGSVLLKNSIDMDCVATLSDWSEYVAPGGGESSYVTAYPLHESGYYVIAKTWYADEMKRPGCVWTHSLLIPFEILNGLDDFKRIGDLFKRPIVNGGYDYYSHTIEYENKIYSAKDYIPVGVERQFEAQLLKTFLQLESGPVMYNAHKDNKTLEDALFAIMNTLPQAMLQKVSWCSGTAYMRKLKGNPLSCQFLSRTIDENYIAENEDEEKWQTFVLDSIMRGDVNQGQLIRMFAEDIETETEYFSAIAKTLYTIEDYFKSGMTSEQRYKEALEIIARAFPDNGNGKVIKKLLLNKIFSDRYCTSFAFFLCVATLPLDNAYDNEEFGLEDRWNGFLSRERDKYLPLLGEILKSGRANKWGAGKLKESVDLMSLKEVTEIIKNDFRLFSSIVLLNPEMLNEVPWSNLTNQEIEPILPLILDERSVNTFRNWDVLFYVLLEKGVEISVDLAKVVFAKTGKATAILLDYVNEDNSRYVNQVLGGQLRCKTEDLLSWLGDVNVINEKVGYAIVNAVDEHSDAVISKGAKIWKPYLGLQFHNLNTQLYTFLFALSFNWPSDQDALALMRMAFYPLHTLQANKQLGYNYWLHIAPYMESVLFWEEWDYCKKMRKTVIKRLKRANANINILDDYTPDATLNAELERMW